MRAAAIEGQPPGQHPRDVARGHLDGNEREARQPVQHRSDVLELRNEHLRERRQSRGRLGDRYFALVFPKRAASIGSRRTIGWTSYHSSPFLYASTKKRSTNLPNAAS